MLTLVRRGWAAPIAVHVAALCLMLVAGAAFVGTYASLSEDEGAAIVQARQLAEHGTWIRDHPYPELDPEGAYYPYELSARGTKGFAPFAKHPLYALVLSGLWRVGGINALIGFSIAGTLVAALVGGRFARRVDPKYERFALWGVALGSPLLVDSYFVIAHTIGAALAGALLLLVTRRSSRHFGIALAAAVALSAALVFMRTEGALFAGVTAVVVLVAGHDRERWLGVATGVAGVGAHFIEKAWSIRIVGPPVPSVLTAEQAVRESARGLGGGGLQGRLDGAILTLFRPDYGGIPANAFLVVTLLAFVGAIVMGRTNRRIGVALALTAALCTVLRVVIGTTGLVPGLFMAAPLLWAGLWAGVVAAERRAFRADHRLLLVLAGFSLAVVATQYARGGGVEWGGRFFALAMSAAVALAVVALATQPVVLRWSVAVVAVAIGLMGLTEVKRIHTRTDVLFDNLHVPGDAVPISILGALPRLDWQRYDQRQFLLVPGEQAADVIEKLQEKGVRRVFVVYSIRNRPKGVPGHAERVANTRWRTIDIELD